jgi:hypothetical protein
MNTYTNVFGGENINQSSLSYKAYGTALVPLAADVLLQWPFEALDGANVTADKIDVIANAGHTFSLPDATLASNGEDILWSNLGSNAFTVLDYAGNTVITVQPGKQWFIYLTDNSTTAGTWHVTQLGAGTSSADAASLAGFGLRANLTKLDQNLLTTATGGNINLTASSRAQVFRNTGGTVTHTFDPAASLGNGWFAIEINAGSGTVTLDPSGAETIDGNPTKVLNPGESCVVYCYGTGFATMGYGRAISTNVAGISIDLAGTGELILNAAQVAAQVQDFTGTLTGARTVTYGTGTGYWFVYNHTNGAFATTFRGSGTDPGVIVAQNTFSILRSQAGTMNIAFTATSGTVTSITPVAGELVTSPNPLVAIGTIGLANMPTPALVPGTYGTASKVATVTVDAKGRTASVVETPIAVLSSAITDLQQLIPPGVMLPYGGITLGSTLWLPCDGSTRLKADYPNLYNAILTTYGPETATTFTLPDTRGRVLAGADNQGPLGAAGRLTAAGFASAVLGAVGGNQLASYGFHLPAIGVAVGQWFAGGGFSGSTVGAQSVNYDSTTDFPGDGGTPVTGGGGGAASAQHTHAYHVHVNTGGEALGFASFGASGGTNAYDGGTSNGANVQPTLIIRHIIKT